jgi:hypothetical protein
MRGLETRVFKWFKLPQLSKMSIGLWDLLLR